MRTVTVFVGFGIEMRGRGQICLWAGLEFLGYGRSAAGSGGRGRPRHTGWFQGLEVGGDAGGFFGGGEHPLVEGSADAAALGLVFDDDEAKEAASGGEAGAQGIDLGEHAIEGEGHVVVFGELEDCEHAADNVTAMASVNSGSG